MLKDWTQTREKLRRRLRGLEEAIDLDAGVRQLDPIHKKRIAKLIREGYEPGKVNNKYPEPAALMKMIGELKAHGQMKEAAILSKTIREIRLLRVVAQKMSGRPKRKEILVRADRRLRGECWACGGRIELGMLVWWDRDHGVVWHEICPTTPPPV
jgi:hypothetical protein